VNNDDYVSLRDFMETQFESIEKRFAQYIEYNNREISSTRRDLDRRLEGMNEFRRQLDAQADTFVTKEAFKDVIRRITDLEKTKYTREGQIALTSALIGFFMLVVALIVKWFR